MATFFISDIHLSPTRLDIFDGFRHTLAYFAAKQADAVYVLGDLFEVWIGDDDASAFHTQVIEAFKQVSSRSIPLFLMHGNRDFLLGKAFAKQCGATLLPDPYPIELYGHSVVLSHGDHLCTADKAYQRFRSWVHTAWLQRLFLTLPLKMRKQLAQTLRSRSQTHAEQKSPGLMDVTDTAVIEMLRAYNASTLIHGHTHRPSLAWHTKPQAYQHIVLSDWHDRINYLEATSDGRVRLKNQPLR